METLVILLLLIRTNPTKIIMSPTAWLYTVAGTFSPLLLLPATMTLNLFFGNFLMVLGGLIAIMSYLSLNRSFGLVPAVREVKTRGLYSFVRHPMYSSYFIIYIGYLFLAFSLYNFVIVITILFLLYKRAHYEEELLRTDMSYLSYIEKVPYRFFPNIL
jgi:protein-S-isoprenylcysteine O-methyltransferase Ste14